MSYFTFGNMKTFHRYVGSSLCNSCYKSIVAQTKRLPLNTQQCTCCKERLAFWLIWWRHQMATMSALLALCEGNPPLLKAVTRIFEVFFDLRMNKRLSKQSRRRWFETTSRSLWRHCNRCLRNLFLLVQWTINRFRQKLCAQQIQDVDLGIAVPHQKLPRHGSLIRYVKIAGAHTPGMPGTFSPPPRVSDPDIHHGTCVTHVPWCMLGSLTKLSRQFPAHAEPAILRIW